MAIDLSLVKSGVQVKAPKLVVYGVGGIGKTTFAAGAPRPIFLFTEEGQGSLDVARFEPRPGDPVLRSWPELIDCCAALHREDHDFETVVIDSMDFAEPLLWEHTAAKFAKSDIEEFGFGKGYVYATDEARVLLQWLDLLRNDRNMAIVVLCHSDAVKFADPGAESYDKYDLRLHKRLAALTSFWADCVLFANYKVTVVRDKEGFNSERKRGVGVGERVLYTEERPAFRAKNRYGLPPEIPLQWAAFESGFVTPQTVNPKPEVAVAATKE